MRSQSLGYGGEVLAKRYLETKGYGIVSRNFRVRGGEIDIIAHDKEQLVFIEVKTRSGSAFGSGDESVTSQKKARMARAISRYLSANRDGEDTDYRIDIIEIAIEPQTETATKITHFKDVEV